MAEVITGSDYLVKTFAERHFPTATAINDIITNSLQNPQFNADEVDTDIPPRLLTAIDSDDLEIIQCEWKEMEPRIQSFSESNV